MDKLVSSPTDPLELVANFDELISKIDHLLTENVRTELKLLIEKKRHLEKKEMCGPNLVINSWIESVFLQFEQFTKASKSGESDVDLVVQSIIKTHRKLANESKKIVDIVAACGCTARTNYLSAIGLGLQLLWFDTNPDKDSRSLPNQIHVLMRSLELAPDVRKEINNIIDNLQLEESENEMRETHMTKRDFNEHFIESGLRCLYKNSVGADNYDPNLPLCDVIANLGFDEKICNLILSTKRNDSIEFALKNFCNLLWLMGNIEETQSAVPKDIINLGDSTNTIPANVLSTIKQTIVELRPKYVVGKNEILINWFNSIVASFDDKVKKVQIRLQSLKEENAKRRLCHSLKHVDPQRFDDLIFTTMDQ